MNLEVRHLQLVEAITDSGSVTKAAERLHVTQSALSHQLREIETRLRTPLFLRVNRRLVLSPAGERLLTSARRVLGELRVVEDDIGRLAANQQGVIRVSTECYTCYRWLPALLKSFHEAWPGIDVEIVPEATRRTIEALHERAIDVGLVHRVPRDRRLRLVPLFEDEMVVVTPQDHRLAAKKWVEAADLAGEHLILHSPVAESFFAETVLAAGVQPRKFSQVILTEAIVEMVRAGIGISAMPRWTIAREIKSGAVAAIRYGRRGLMRRWQAAMLRTAVVPEPLQEFVDLMKAAELAVQSPPHK